MCLLLIEGSPLLRQSLATGFRRAGYEIETVSDVERGFLSAQASRHEVILIDADLPGSDWLELLRRLRAEGTGASIILLTPPRSVAERVRGLNSGADDCLPRPFSFEELLARVRAHLRCRYRSRPPGIRIEGLVIDSDARRVTLNDVAIGLTRREFRILEYLARRAGETVSRFELEEHLYGEDNVPLSNAVASAICVLRRKLGEASGNQILLHTQRGRGYSLNAAG